MRKTNLLLRPFWWVICDMGKLKLYVCTFNTPHFYLVSNLSRYFVSKRLFAIGCDIALLSV